MQVPKARQAARRRAMISGLGMHPVWLVVMMLAVVSPQPSPARITTALALPNETLTPPLVDIAARSTETTDIQAALPDDSALIQFRRVLVAARGASSRESRYTALLALRDSREHIDLGSVVTIDRQIDAFREAVILKKDVVPSGRALYDALLSPIVTRLDTTHRLFVVPDANLRLVPFAALVDERGHCAIERLSIHYLSSSHDVLRPWTSTPAADGPMVALVNPSGADLPGTGRAAERLVKLFRDVEVLTGDAATEARLREHTRPRLLHVGAHGFFEAAYEYQDSNIHTGLLLAGVPRDKIASDDGLLTSDELAAMDLRGTELVALSVCNSGRDAANPGDGALGLRQALVVAGSRTQIVSLWWLPDGATAKLWDAYYLHLAAGEGRGEAMRHAQLELLGTEEHRHPRDWAGFVVFGEWEPLVGAPLVVPSSTDVPTLVPGRGCRASIGRFNGANAHILLGWVLLVLHGRRKRAHVGWVPGRR